jgi:predicted alpha-1,6-mannanase (GH76 family)
MFKVLILFLLSSAVFAKNIKQQNPYLIDFQSDVIKVMDFYSPDVKFWQDKNCIHPGSCVGHEQGLWFWAQAAMIIANYQEQTSDGKYSSVLKDSYTANWQYIINARYYDDRLWWALTLIKIYQINGDEDALNKAKSLLMSVVSQGSQNICHGDGGIYWDEDKTQVGSIANTLLITIASRLYLISHDKLYKDIANKTWSWLRQSGLLAPDYSLADNYIVNSKGQCGGLLNWHYTYNNGMLLEAVSSLAQINNQKKLWILADNIAKKALYDYSKGGVIEETCTNAYACADDKFMFKGIFVYNLALYAKQNKHKMNNIRKQLANNYAVLLNNQSSSQVYAFNWSLPVNFERDGSLYNPADIVSHLSAVYLELANVILN